MALNLVRWNVLAIVLYLYQKYIFVMYVYEKIKPVKCCPTYHAARIRDLVTNTGGSLWSRTISLLASNWVVGLNFPTFPTTPTWKAHLSPASPTRTNTHKCITMSRRLSDFVDIRPDAKRNNTGLCFSVTFRLPNVQLCAESCTLDKIG